MRRGISRDLTQVVDASRGSVLRSHGRAMSCQISSTQVVDAGPWYGRTVKLKSCMAPVDPHNKLALMVLDPRPPSSPSQNRPPTSPVNHMRCSADHRPAWRCDAGPDVRRAVGVCMMKRARAARSAPHLTSAIWQGTLCPKKQVNDLPRAASGSANRATTDRAAPVLSAAPAIRMAHTRYASVPPTAHVGRLRQSTSTGFAGSKKQMGDVQHRHHARRRAWLPFGAARAKGGTR